MKRISHITKATNLHGSGKDGYTDGSRATQVPSSVLNADAMNPLQEEPARAIEAVLGQGSLTGGYAQLVAALLGATDAYAASKATMGVDVGAVSITDAASNAVEIVLVNSATANNLHHSQYGAAYSAVSLGTAALYGCAYQGSAKYGVGKFCAVGASGKIYSGTDGGAMTSRTPAGGYTNNFRSVLYSERLGLWVVVGDAAEIQTSPDTLTGNWTHRAAGGGFVGNFIKVVEGGDYSTPCLIAMGAGGEVQRSLDGITWNHVATLAHYSAGINDIAYTPDGWLAVVDSAGGGSFYAHRSVDGVTWEQFTIATNAEELFISPKTGALVGYNPGNGTWCWLPHSRAPLSAERVLVFDVAKYGIKAVRTQHAWVFGHDTGETYVTKHLPY